MPNSNASPAVVDFITALGRLLHSGALRDAFAADPQRVAREIGLRESDRAAFVQLPSDDLEAQATVLLRKRFDLVKPLLPATCAALGREAFPAFRRYARTAWPKGRHAAAEDARGFARALRAQRHPALCPLEYNRGEFTASRARWALRFASKVPIGATSRPALQIFLRRRSGWSEWLLHLGL